MSSTRTSQRNGKGVWELWHSGKGSISQPQPIWGGGVPRLAWLDTGSQRMRVEERLPFPSYRKWGTIPHKNREAKPWGTSL